MDELASWQRLMTWLSPAFPIGSFAYSGGLETAILSGMVITQATLENWIVGNLHHGSAYNDAIFLGCAYRAHSKRDELAEISALALALVSAQERVAELTDLARSFQNATSAWPLDNPPPLPEPCAFPVTIGALCAAHDMPLVSSTAAFLTALVQTQISVAIRLVPLGQTDGLALQAKLEPKIAELARHIATCSLDDLGGIAYSGDIATMAHETQTTRIFRS